MAQLVELMAAPFAACVVLVGIHAYLGMHVIQRKVIFVDLALAQIAALGATFGFLLGLGPHEPGAYVFSLGFAIVGAAIFALTRMRHERIPQEAIIGIVYSVALASAILVADRAPEGAEHIKETLVGMLLWVRWPAIAKTALIYALVGALHFALRKRFFQISFEPEKAYAEGRWVRVWDFIFYVTFAFVITSSVAMAGVLVVFSFLVIPAVIATLFATRIGTRLAVGWSVGIAACLIGLVASYRFDMPSGPSVVSSMGIALLLAGLLYYIFHAKKKRYAVLKVAAGALLVAGVIAGFGILATSGAFLHIDHEHDWEQEPEPVAAPAHGLRLDIESACGDDRSCAVDRLLAEEGWDRPVDACLQVDGAEDREWWLRFLGRVEDPRAADLLASGAAGESDPLLKLEWAVLLADRGDRRGLVAAAGLLGEEIPPLVRDEAHALLAGRAGSDFGYDPFGSGEDNAAAMKRIEDWLHGN